MIRIFSTNFFYLILFCVLSLWLYGGNFITRSDFFNRLTGHKWRQLPDSSSAVQYPGRILARKDLLDVVSRPVNFGKPTRKKVKFPSSPIMPDLNTIDGVSPINPDLSGKEWADTHLPPDPTRPGETATSYYPGYPPSILVPPSTITPTPVLVPKTLSPPRNANVEV